MTVERVDLDRGEQIVCPCRSLRCLRRRHMIIKATVFVKVGCHRADNYRPAASKAGPISASN